MVGTCKCGNKLSGSIKSGGFLNYVVAENRFVFQEGLCSMESGSK